MSQLETSRPTSPSLALVGSSPQAPVRRGQRGLVSAEWAMAIIAAVAIVGVVVALVKSGVVHDVLLTLIKGVIKAALDLF